MPLFIIEAWHTKRLESSIYADCEEDARECIMEELSNNGLIEDWGISIVDRDPFAKAPKIELIG